MTYAASSRPSTSESTGGTAHALSFPAFSLSFGKKVALTKGRAMRTLIGRFWRDESGSVMVGDWAFVATILVLGAVTGMIVMHQPTPDDSDDASHAAVVHPAR
jgi:hypothetical protein